VLKGDLGGANADFTQAIKLDPMDAGIYVERGKVLALRNNHRAAIADFTKAIDLDSSLAQAYACRGLARLQLKDVEGASSDYEQAIALEPAQRDATELSIKIEKARQHKK
jgi:tetratricopeptide (TPR) repeat protein